MNDKKHLGQFFTKNVDYILHGFSIPDDVSEIIEPFAGECDLLKFIESKNASLLENAKCYDIDPKKENVIHRDTLKEPLDYNGKFVITNPPYLARNKNAKDKSLYEKYGVNDLYKCFIQQLVLGSCRGGILIIPLNFWCSVRKNDVHLRRTFLEKYHIVRLNIFEERVFDDTSYTICSFQFCARTSNNNKEDSNNTIEICIFPSKTQLCLVLNASNNYTFGGELYSLPKQNKYTIGRLIKDQTPSTQILAKCIDDDETKKIGLSFVERENIYFDETPNKSARTYATLTIQPVLTEELQKTLIDKVNAFINEKRDTYHSLFLTNYRESKKIARKRITFDLLYDIVGFILCHDNEFAD